MWGIVPRMKTVHIRAISLICWSKVLVLYQEDNQILGQQKRSKEEVLKEARDTGKEYCEKIEFVVEDVAKNMVG